MKHRRHNATSGQQPAVQQCIQFDADSLRQVSRATHDAVAGSTCNHSCIREADVSTVSKYLCTLGRPLQTWAIRRHVGVTEYILDRNKVFAVAPDGIRSLVYKGPYAQTRAEQLRSELSQILDVIGSPLNLSDFDIQVWKAVQSRLDSDIGYLTTSVRRHAYRVIAARLRNPNLPQL